MMNDFEISPDDPRLTAYALGELEGDERATIEAALRRDPELRATVEDIRATSAQIEIALVAEPTEETTEPMTLAPLVPFEPNQLNRHADDLSVPLAFPAQRTGILPGYDVAKLDGGPRPKSAGAARRGPPRLIRFPSLYFVVGGAAAACFGVFAVLHQSPGPLGTRAPKGANTVAKTTPLFAPIADPEVADAPPIVTLPGANGATTEVAAVTAEPGASDALVEPALLPNSEAIVAENLIPPDTMLSSGLPLLEQTRQPEPPASPQVIAESAPTFSPLTPPRASLSLSERSAPTVGFPAAASSPLLPPVLVKGRDSAPVGTNQAIVRSTKDFAAELLREKKAQQNTAANPPLPRVEPAGRLDVGPRVKTQPRPAYPYAMKRDGVSGQVYVSFIVDRDGAVLNATVVNSTHAEFEAPAIEAVRRWRFEPGRIAESPVATRLQVPIIFSIEDEPASRK